MFFFIFFLLCFAFLFGWRNWGRVERSGWGESGQAKCMFVNNSGHPQFFHCLICKETGEVNLKKKISLITWKNRSETDREVCCPFTCSKRILSFVLDPPLSSLIVRFRSYGLLPNLSLSLIE